MQGEYKIMINREVVTYTNYDDIPESFDKIISFKPDFPPDPHSDEDHAFMDTFNSKLQALKARQS